MKVLLVHNFNNNKYIGGEDVVFENEKSALIDMIGSENVFTFNLSNNNYNNFVLILLSFFPIWQIYTIYKLLVTNKISVVHCHNFFPIISPYLFILTKLLGVKTVLTLHNYRIWCPKGTLYRDNKLCSICINKSFHWDAIRFKCYRNSRIQTIANSVLFWLYKVSLAFSCVDKFIVLTNFQKNFLVDNKLIKENKIVIKHNFVRHFLPETLSQNKKYDFIFVGLLDKSKGIDLILNYFNNENCNFTICIIGDGPLKYKLNNTTKNITYVGKIANQDIINYIQCAKYLLHTSLMFETFGLTIIESMSVGVPVLGFPIGTRLDLITNGINGFYIDTNNMNKSLTEALNISDTQYLQLSQNCYKTVERFSQSRLIQDQVNLYRNILNT